MYLFNYLFNGFFIQRFGLLITFKHFFIQTLTLHMWDFLAKLRVFEPSDLAFESIREFLFYTNIDSPP